MGWGKERRAVENGEGWTYADYGNVLEGSRHVFLGGKMELFALDIWCRLTMEF